jgi:hypothetical protein
LGLRALERIKRGTFVIEYNGEVISREEASKRASEASNHNYILTLSEFSGKGKNSLIDLKLVFRQLHQNLHRR